MITYKPTYNQSYIQDYFPAPPEIKGYRKQFSIETPRGEDTEIPTIDLLAEDPIKEATPKQETPTSKVYNNNKNFISDLESAYTKELTKRGLNPEYAKYLTAQDALETGYGRSYKGNFNFGNITVGSSGASYAEGKDKDALGNTITQKFRNYDSLDDYVNHKISLLSSSRYNAFNGDINKFYNRVKAGGYAEDPEYISKLNRVYNSIYKAKNGTKLPKFQNSGIIPEAKKYVEKVSKGEIELKDVPRKYYSYVEGELKGANQTSKALNDTGNKILDTADKVTMWIPGAIGSVNWLAHIGANAANKEYGKVAGDIAMASLLGAAGKWIGKGIRNLGLKTKARYLSNIDTTSKQNSSEEEILKAWNAGKEDAVKYLSSDTKKSIDNHNIELAKRKFGIDLKPFPWPERAKVEPKIELKNSTNMKPNLGGEVTRPSISSPEQDIVKINLDHNVNETAFHENLHRGYIGTSMSKKSNGFYEWKTKKLLLPNPGTYMSDSEEAAVNLLEIGRKYNLLETPYPGKIKAKSVLQEIMETDPNSRSRLSVTRWEDKPKRVWDALQGKYLGVTPFILINRQNESESVK